MRFFSNLSIRRKIIGIILLTNVVGLGIAFSLIIFFEQKTIKENLEENARLSAQVVGAYMAIAIEFNTRDTAQQELEAMLAKKDDILEAYIFEDGGELFIHYHSREQVRSGRQLPWPDLSNPENRFLDDYMEVFEDIVYERVVDQKNYGTICMRVSTEALDSLLSDYYRKVGGVLLVVVAVSFAFAFMLGRVISGPILQLADVARKISEQGDYSIRVRKIGRDEIASLCDVFNDMLRQIQRRQLELERSNRELDHFAYVTSHDLKAPLRAISTLSAWIEEDLGDKVGQEGREQLELLRGRVRRMEGLIDGILEYSRVERMDADLERVNLRETIEGVIELLGVPESVTIEVSGEMPTFVTKRLRLQQVLSNLIGNAVKYNHRKDPRVHVSVRRAGRFFEITVSDNGPGIAPDYHEKVFLIFQTLQSRDEIESTGVGLALVKKIVEGEGGTVTLESAEGMGSTFRFSWPKGPGTGSAEIAAQ